MLSKKLLSLPLFLFLATGLFASAAFALDAPRDPRGTEIRQEVIKWEWEPVPGAVKYKITVDGIDLGTIEDTKYFSYGMWPGDHSMHLRAVDGDGRESPRTPTAKIFTSEKFSYGTHGRSFLVNDGPSPISSPAPNPPAPTPAPSSAASSAPPPPSTQAASTGGVTTMVQNLRYENLGGGDVRWRWDSFPGAVRYELTVDGVAIGGTPNTTHVSMGLWVGEHSLTVKATDSSGRQTVQSETLKANVTDDSSAMSQVAEASPAPPPPPPAPVVTAAAPTQDASAEPARQQPQNDGVDKSAASIQSLVDPASFSYPEVRNMSGYELTFSDEFNGDAVNPYRWHTQLRWDGDWNGERYEYRIVNNEDQFYVNVLAEDPEHQRKIVPLYNPFKFNGSTMSIQAVKNPLRDRDRTKTHGKLDDIVRQQPFLSGVISSHEKFAQKYGRFEARIKIPNHVGTFPAFWLFHAKRAWEGTQRTEIDIMENLGHAPQYVYNSFHYFTNVSRTYGGDGNFIRPKPNGQIYTGQDFSQNFHTYSVEWEPGKVTWFIDGVQTSELYNSMVDFEELYVMANLAMGGNWTNFPTTAGGLGRPEGQRFPTGADINELKNPRLEIDFIRVYRRK